MNKGFSITGSISLRETSGGSSSKIPGMTGIAVLRTWDGISPFMGMNTTGFMSALTDGSHLLMEERITVPMIASLMGEIRRQ
ncbi:MAG: hypothetical protein ACK4OO_06560 [bacterium]